VIQFVKRLFSSPKAIEDTLASARRGLDDLVYTDQEKDERTERAQELYSKLWMAAVPSAVSRRLIAVSVVFTYCFLLVTAVALHVAGMIESAEFTLALLGEALVNPFNIIIGFYFLKQVVDTYRNKDGRSAD